MVGEEGARVLDRESLLVDLEVVQLGAVVDPSWSNDVAWEGQVVVSLQQVA